MVKKVLADGAGLFFVPFDDLFNDFRCGLEDAVFHGKVKANATMEMSTAVESIAQAMAIEEKKLFAAIGIIMADTFDEGSAIAMALWCNDDIVNRIITSTLFSKTND